MMKAGSLAFLRIACGMLLVIWGLIKLGAPDAAIHVSDKYYFGLFSADALQRPLGAAEALLGFLVVIGLMRPITLPLQALVLGFGALAIWRYLLDPLGLFLLTEETRQVLFFPSLGIAAASLVLLAFQKEDRFAMDTLFRNKSRL